ASLIFFFQAEDGIRDGHVTGVQTCALPISAAIHEIALGGRELPLGVERFDLDVRVRKLEQHRVRLYRNAGLDEDALDSRGSQCRSEERRVGKECRFRWAAYQYKIYK